jgi:hypothetical protein
MNVMKPSPLNTILLCVALALADAAVAAGTQTTYSAAFILLAGLCFGQLTLLAAWTIAGSGPWIARVLTSLTVASGLAQLLAPATAASWPSWTAALVAYWLTASVTIWFITTTARSSRQESRPRPLQYSLGSLISVITLMSVLLGMAHWISISGAQLASFAPIGIWMLVVGTVALQGALPSQHVWMVVTLVTAVAAGPLLSRTTGLYDAGFFTLLCLVEVGTIFIGMLAVKPSHAVVHSDTSGTARVNRREENYRFARIYRSGATR